MFANWYSWVYDGRDDGSGEHYLEEVALKDGELVFTENYLPIGEPPFGQEGDPLQLGEEEMVIVKVDVEEMGKVPFWVITLQKAGDPFPAEKAEPLQKYRAHIVEKQAAEKQVNQKHATGTHRSTH